MVGRERERERGRLEKVGYIEEGTEGLKRVEEESKEDLRGSGEN